MKRYRMLLAKLPTSDFRQRSKLIGMPSIDLCQVSICAKLVLLWKEHFYAEHLSVQNLYWCAKYYSVPKYYWFKIVQIFIQSRPSIDVGKALQRVECSRSIDSVEIRGSSHV